MPSKTKATTSISKRIARKGSRPVKSPRSVQIKSANSRDLPVIRALFRQYEDYIETDLCFQNFKQELADLPGPYAPPAGSLLIAWQGKEPAGCVALRKVKPGVCEMKRLFVRPQFQGRGLGRGLAEAIISQASSIGYREMRLDTLPKLKSALAIYELLGFVRIPPYHDYPNKEIIFMALSLR
jgi:putative acetyltransferase